MKKLREIKNIVGHGSQDKKANTKILSCFLAFMIAASSVSATSVYAISGAQNEIYASHENNSIEKNDDVKTVLSRFIDGYKKTYGDISSDGNVIEEKINSGFHDVNKYLNSNTMIPNAQEYGVVALDEYRRTKVFVSNEYEAIQKMILLSVFEQMYSGIKDRVSYNIASADKELKNGFKDDTLKNVSQDELNYIRNENSIFEEKYPISFFKAKYKEIEKFIPGWETGTLGKINDKEANSALDSIISEYEKALYEYIDLNNLAIKTVKQIQYLKDEKEFKITVEGGKAFNSIDKEIEKSLTLGVVNLKANNPPEGKVFDKWEIESEEKVDIHNISSEKTYFTMPLNNVVIKAIWKDKLVEEKPIVPKNELGDGNLAPEPEVDKKTPDVEKKTPDVEKKTPDVEKKTPDVEKKTPDVEKKTPDVEKKTPDVGKKTPDVEKKTPDVEKKTPDVEKKTPDVGKKTPEVGKIKPEGDKKLPEKRDINSSIEKRIAGSDRIKTSIKVSEELYPNGSNVIILANKDKFSDVLTSVPLSVQKHAPILYIEKDFIPHNVMNEITRLKAKEVYLIGGLGSISKNIEHSLEKKSVQLKRFDGEDRYDTAKLIADEVRKNGSKTTIELASGETLPDAISISNLAVKENAPILLTRKDSLPADIEKALKEWNISKVNIAGQTSTISKNVEDSLRNGSNMRDEAIPYDLSKGIKELKRLGGKDRYETSAIISKEANTNAKLGVYASGETFADSLVAGSYAGIKKGTVLIVSKDKINSSIRDYIKNSKMDEIKVIGGSNSVSNDVLDMLNSLVKK